MDENENSCDWYDVACGAKWWVDEIKALALWFYDQLLQGFLSLINVIPVPEFMANPANFTLPGDVLYWTSLFKVGWGLSVVVSAYLARFILRRIPLIG